MLKKYYQLTKPGIIYGNIMVAAAGFLLASKNHINLDLLVSVLAGTALVIASSCVLNNYIDRDIDKNMARTKNRAFASGSISTRNALLFAAFLGAAGFLILILFTNPLTAAIGLVGMFFYVVVYAVGKRKTIYGTIIGSISGALPPVAGYTAASNRIDRGAIILFLIMVCWQMPHFYAISIYRFNDYKKAGLPVWPIKKGIKSTKIQILVFIIAFIVATSLLKVYGYTGYTYLAIVIILGLYWLKTAIMGFKKPIDDAKWARKVFFFSLSVLLVLSVMLAIGPHLP